MKKNRYEILKKNCLVVNAWGKATNLTTVGKAILKTFNGRFKIVHPFSGELYTLDEWIKKGVETDNQMSCSCYLIDVPTIVQAIHYDGRFLRTTPLNKPNLFKRDGHKCWYCNSKKNLTVDHIVPECRGGRWSWKNLITCCYDCNNEKDQMEVEKFCEIKKCEIPRPISLATTPWLLGVCEILPEWKERL